MMKQGYLIVNGFLQGDKFIELYEALRSRGIERGLELTLKTNIELMMELSKGEVLTSPSGQSPCLPPFAIFWDKDVRLARALEMRGMRLFNPAGAIELCDDKALTHIALMDVVPQPKTVLIPLTFPRVGYTKEDFLEVIAQRLKFPFVIKECFGSFGAQVYLANNMEQARALLHSTNGSAIIAQEFLKNSFGRDVRAYVAGGRVAAAMLRENHSGDFRANVALGGSARAYTLSREQEEMALMAAKTLKCDFAGVDLLFGKNGQSLVCEVNSNAHFAGITEATGIDVAQAIIDAVSAAV